MPAKLVVDEARPCAEQDWLYELEAHEGVCPIGREAQHAGMHSELCSDPTGSDKGREVEREGEEGEREGRGRGGRGEEGRGERQGRDVGKRGRGERQGRVV